MIKIHLKYLVRDTDRHGNHRYYVAKRGFAKIRIRAHYGTSAFMDEYQRALASLGKPKVVAEKLPEGSFEALCRKYISSSEFQASLAPSTKKTKLRELQRLWRKFGALPANLIESRHIRKWMDELSETPAAANQLLKTLRPIFRYGLERGLLKANPCDKVTKVRYRTKSHHTWTRDEVNRFFATHPEGSSARLAVTLFLLTGLRLCDVAELRPDQIAGDEILTRARKTGTDLRLYVHPELRGEIGRHVLTGNTMLLTAFGKPFSTKGLANKMKQWCKEAGIPHCSPHGLRSAGATMAAENGATVPELMAMYGWTNPSMAMKYVAAADKKLLSRRATERINLDFTRTITPTAFGEWEENLKTNNEINASRGRVAHPTG